jgi:hypothetical protein
MDDRGNIYRGEEVEALRAQVETTLNTFVREGIKAKLAGMIEIDDADLDLLSTMNRARRVAWYAEVKKAKKHGRPIPSPNEV